jgi:hypothetical protein
MLAILLVQVGGGTALCGCVALALGATSSDSRHLGALLLAAGVIALVTGLKWPARSAHARTKGSRIDDFVPEYQFAEAHDIVIQASAARIYEAVHAVTAREIAFFRTLTWIRRAGRTGPASILNPPPDEPLLTVATRTTFITLAEVPDIETLVGIPVIAPRGWHPERSLTPEAFRQLTQPGFALAAMNFRIEGLAAGRRLTTETRIFATDAGARRQFALYWRLIYPGSAFIRRMWLRAIKRRAERTLNASTSH